MTSAADTPDKRLFTPGPLTTSATVKQAMLHDLGSRDQAFIEIVREIRQRLLALAGVSQRQGFETVLMQGSGTFAIESVVSSFLPAGGTLMVLANGAYGRRMAEIARRHGITVECQESPESQPIDIRGLAAKLQQRQPAALAVVHCETTSGVLNPIAEVAAAARESGTPLIVDSMSAFGAIPVDVGRLGIDFLVSSANKCIEGVPGFGLVICRRNSLEQCAGRARTVSLDLHAQWQGLESNGQFRFTPPTHALLAFRQALDELQQEGGVAARQQRYVENHRIILEGMQSLGFRPYVDPQWQAPIITAFHLPARPDLTFERLYEALNQRGLVIYPGKVTDADCFRIGNIGRLGPPDMRDLLDAMRQVVGE